ncbi:MAG TPA: dihydroorotase [Verrucomicrobiae bacterium]|nr:dihydroorotase [Verrucomicrobiae bacterium]
MKPLVIRRGRVIDPANGVDEVRDVFVVDGKIATAAAPAAEEIDAKGKIVAPGLIDMHVHLREPGRSDKETIETGARCAARGGFTSVVCMPNTTPAADNTGTIALIKQRAAEVACVNILPTGAITKELKGEELAPIGSLKKAGVVAITDDGRCVQNNELMRRAVEYAKMFNVPVLDHCQDDHLTADGVMNDGYWSAALGLRGWPSIGEVVIVARNVLIAELTDWHIHCQHISSGRSVQLIREAKKCGVKISGEACPHHFTLTDEAVKTYDTNFKMNPPLRTEWDRQALLEGLADGAIEIIASDHAPHCSYEKEVEFDCAPFGILGLETELALSLELVRKKLVGLSQLIEKFTVNPARLLRLNKGTLSVGADADITLIDLDRQWTYDVRESASKSRNSPFHGWKLKGKAVATVTGGKIVWREK